MSVDDKRSKIADNSLAQAQRYLADQQFGRSFPHFLVFAQLKRDIFLANHVEAFISTVTAFSSQLEAEDKTGKVFQVYEQAIDVLPDHPLLLTNYGAILFKQNKFCEAEKIFRRVLSLDSQFLLARDRLENLANSLLERWHFPMLNDRDRNEKYKKAISKKIKDGCSKTVLDVGTGTGLLSLYASESGAERVYACEASQVLAITAADVFSINSAGERIKLLNKISVDLDKDDIPEPIDLLVTETFDAGLLGEHVLLSLDYAWKNQLQFPSPSNPFGNISCVIPASAQFFAAPISCPAIRHQNRFSRAKYGYLDMSSIDIRSVSSDPYDSEYLRSVPGGYEQLTQPARILRVNFNDRHEIEELAGHGKEVEVDLAVTAEGDFDAVAGWFTLNLDDEEELSSAPSNDRSCWQQAIFPVHHTNSKVSKDGDVIRLKFLISTSIRLANSKINRSQKTKNGVGEQEKEKAGRTVLNLSPSLIRPLNNPSLEEVYQWVAYYAARDVKVTYIADVTGELPLLGLQLLVVSPTSKLTLSVNTEERQQVGGLLDFVSAVAMAKQSAININNVSCLTEPVSEGAERYNLVLVNPVLACGRLNQTCLASLPALVSTLVPDSGLILPHKLQLWCQVVESEELGNMSHLRSNEPVSGFKIADQINILAVTHLQDINKSTLKMTELTEAVHARDIELTDISLERTFTESQADVISTGTATSVLYWFTIEFGWGIQFSTLQGNAYSQAAVMVAERRLEAGQPLTILTHTENGLVNFSVK